MHDENCLFRASKRSNRAQNDLNKLMEALLFISDSCNRKSSGLSLQGTSSQVTSPASAGEVSDAWRVAGGPLAAEVGAWGS